MAPSASATRIRILMLHGFTQNGELFHAKTRALEKSLQKAFPPPKYNLSLIYPTAPMRLHAADVSDPAALGLPSNPSEEEESEAYGWWVRRGSTEPYEYVGMEKGLDAVATVLKRDGPFDGTIGFSQGGALAGMVASLLEHGRKEAFTKLEAQGGMPFPAGFDGIGEHVGGKGQEPLKFAVSYSGFGASNNPLYRGFSEPKIKTPMLHFLGSLDTVVDESRSLRLVEACEGGKGRNGERVVYHPGGHFVPATQKQLVGVLVSFIREMVDGTVGEAVEAGVEDMDVPF